MADQIIAATLQVNTGSSNANIKEVNKNLTDVKGNLKDTGSAAVKTGKDIEGSAGNFKNLKTQMSALPGPLGAVKAGTEGVSSAFKALLANPLVALIAAIVAGLALLYKAFTNTFEGAQKVEEIFASVKAAAQALFDNLGRIARAIVKFFSFDFSGAADEIKGIVNDVENAYNAMSKLTRQAQQLHQEQLQNDLEQAERQKKLAVLREQATDEDVPLAKRKAALKELAADAEKNAKEDIDLAKRTAENKIAQLTLEKDGARKNQDEINKIKIEQINVETENANELRRINKQLTAAEKQELAERKEAQKAASEAAKQRRQELLEFNNKLVKLQQENELLLIKDGYEKELKQLTQKIADEKRVNEQEFKDRKITKAQQQQLNAELDIQLAAQVDVVTDKHNKEIREKEVAFQKELAGIKGKTSLDAIKDIREKERVELQIGYEEKLQDAITRYRDDQAKLQDIKQALQDKLAADQAKLDDKNLKEDQKKGFAKSEAENKAVIDKHNLDFEAQKAAVDAQQQLVQDAFDQQIITEADYNIKVAGLAEARKTIREQEAAHHQLVASSVANALSTLSEIAGKQTLLGKALAIASTTISTYQSAIGAFKGMVTTIPGPVGIALGVVAAAGALATGIAAVKKIVAVQVPGKGGGGAGSVPTGLPAAAAPVAPQQTGTKLDADSLNNIGNAAAGGVNRSFKAYVVEQDSSAAANRAARLQGASVLGGG